MTCPKCRGFVGEHTAVLEDGWWRTQHCLNCGWYAPGEVVTRYTAVRPVVVATRWKPDL